MSREGRFYIHCIETYKQAKGLTGKQTIELFQKYKVAEYIYDQFAILHIHGDQYIIQDIDEYIAKQK